jgi:arylesterase / paraoxonase
MMKRTMWLHALAGAAAMLALGGCAAVRAGNPLADTPAIGGPCIRIPLRAGAPEDIAMDPQGGFWVSASNWRGRQRSEAIGRGAIYRLRFDHTGAPQLTDVTPPAPVDFQPHGIDLWTSPDGETRLFVVNHPLGGASRVEIFRVEGDRLAATNDGRVYELLHRPNDVAAFGPASFFATNDHDVPRTAWFRPTPWERFQDISGWRGGSMIRVVEGEATEVVTGLALPNGIALSADGQRLFVAESTAAAVRTYGDLSAPRLRLLNVRRVGPGPDNLNRTADGRLWMGAHSNGVAFLRHVMRARVVSPGRVAVFDPEGWGEPNVVYQSGTKDLSARRRGLSAVSVGVPDGPDAVVVGNIFTPALERCAIAR